MRRILHVDMDAFYASVEQRDDPRLRGKPVAVGGASGRGVVCAASYEARRFGVRSAMPMSRAVGMCPGLVVVPPDFTKYQAASEKVFAVFREATALVEGASLDEAYLDVTENAWGLELGREVARRIKARILEETALTASAGVGPNKLVAKIASGFRKPDGLTVVPPARVLAFLAPLPVDSLFGVGPKTAARLRAIGIETVAQVRTADPRALQAAVGSFAEALVAMSFGEDDRPVEAERARRSVGQESTFEEDLREAPRIREELASLGRAVGDWLEENGVAARTVTIKVRYSDFETVTRSETRRPHVRNGEDVARRAVPLLGKTEAGRRAVRLLGVSCSGLIEGEVSEGRQLVFPFAL